ncbi:MAG: hypothetical protein ACI80N_003521, partial [Gammaproteobacteria bacterium]
MALSLLGACASLQPDAPRTSTGSLDRKGALALIGELEDARKEGNGQLVQLTRHVDPAVRARTMVALGRLPLADFGDEVTKA